LTQFLIKHFVKSCEDIKNAKVRESYGKLSGTVGILCNISISVAKLIVGFLFNSVSVMADAANNVFDALSSIVTLIGVKMSGKPADKEHPYGHERIEYMAGLVVSFLILFIGVELVKISVSRIFSDETSSLSILGFIVLAGSVCVKLWMYFFNRQIGTKIESSLILATAQDSLNDVIASSAVLVSALITYFSKFDLDGYVGVGVALYIIYAGVKLIKDTADPLLGTAPSPQLIETIHKKIYEYNGVEGMHDLILHNYGPKRCFASVHIEVCAKQDVLVSHDLADNIERDFKKDLGIELVVHLDPLVKDDETVNKAREMITEILGEIDENITYHDLRIVKGNTHSTLIFDICVPADFSVCESELIDTVINAVHIRERTYECVITVDKNYL